MVSFAEFIASVSQSLSVTMTLAPRALKRLFHVVCGVVVVPPADTHAALLHVCNYTHTCVYRGVMVPDCCSVYDRSCECFWSSAVGGPLGIAIERGLT